MFPLLPSTVGVLAVVECCRTDVPLRAPPFLSPPLTPLLLRPVLSMGTVVVVVVTTPYRQHPPDLVCSSLRNLLR